jgi:flagellin-specific chaperone FliS
MNKDKQAKIKRFMNDLGMQRAVYEVVLESFLKPRKDADVHQLAAGRLAIDLLQEAWKELEKVKETSEPEATEPKQVGL